MNKCRLVGQQLWAVSIACYCPPDCPDALWQKAIFRLQRDRKIERGVSKVAAAQPSVDAGGHHMFRRIQDIELLFRGLFCGLMRAPESDEAGYLIAGHEGLRARLFAQNQVVLDRMPDFEVMRISIKGLAAAAKDETELMIHVDPSSLIQFYAQVFGIIGNVADEFLLAGVPENPAMSP